MPLFVMVLTTTATTKTGMNQPGRTLSSAASGSFMSRLVAASAPTTVKTVLGRYAPNVVHPATATGLLSRGRYRARSGLLPYESGVEAMIARPVPSAAASAVPLSGSAGV